MLENALTSLLISVTRRYAKISTSDAGIGISGGRLVLDDVELRAERLSSPALPFSIVSGRARRLAVRVPWSALSSSPVRVELQAVTLIAGRRGPRAPAQEAERGRQRKEQREEEWDGERWYGTVLGRVLFNVAVDLRDVVLVYRDEECVGEVRVGALRGYSCGSDWEEAFLPLTEELQAVALRKKVEVEHLSCSFRPVDGESTGKMLGKEAESRPDSEEQHLSGNGFKELFESKYPVLQDLRVLGKILVYAGENEHAEFESGKSSGWHAELDLEVDDPKLSFTAQQIRWLKGIFKGAGSDKELSGDLQKSRAVSPAVVRKRQRVTYKEEYSASDSSTGGDTESETGVSVTKSETRGAFRSFWDMLTGEHGDDSVDDAEIALGFKPREQVKLSRQKEKDEVQEARQAAEDAARSGGFTCAFRIVTPDRNARKSIEKFAAALEKERQLRKKFSQVEQVIEEAERRVVAAEDRAEAAERRNTELLTEIFELERAAGESIRNKDALIRQIEAALYQAERRLQALTMKIAPLPSPKSPHHHSRKGRESPSRQKPNSISKTAKIRTSNEAAEKVAPSKTTRQSPKSKSGQDERAYVRERRKLQSKEGLTKHKTNFSKELIVSPDGLTLV